MNLMPRMFVQMVRSAGRIGMDLPGGICRYDAPVLFLCRMHYCIKKCLLIPHSVEPSNSLGSPSLICGQTIYSRALTLDLQMRKIFQMRRGIETWCIQQMA